MQHEEPARENSLIDLSDYQFRNKKRERERFLPHLGRDYFLFFFWNPKSSLRMEKKWFSIQLYVQSQPLLAMATSDLNAKPDWTHLAAGWRTLGLGRGGRWGKGVDNFHVVDSVEGYFPLIQSPNVVLRGVACWECLFLDEMSSQDPCYLK